MAENQRCVPKDARRAHEVLVPPQGLKPADSVTAPAASPPGSSLFGCM